MFNGKENLLLYSTLNCLRSRKNCQVRLTFVKKLLYLTDVF